MSQPPASAPDTQVARFFVVRRLADDAQQALASLADARREAQRLAAQQDGQFGVFELVDAYQRGQPPVAQVAVRR